MAAVFFQFIWQINDADSFKRAFFIAYTASAAEALGDNCFGAFNPYGFYPTAHHRAIINAEVVAFFDFAFIFVEYGNSRHG